MRTENHFELQQKLAVNNATKTALLDAKRINHQLDEMKNDDLEGGCSIVSLVYLFGYESLVLSEEQEYEDTRKFNERLLELVEERGLSLVVPNSSGEFLNLIVDDDFYGCLIVTETEKDRVGHMLAARPTYTRESDDNNNNQFSKAFAVIDVGRENKTGVMKVEDMIDYYTDAVVVDSSDGGYFRGIYVLMTPNESEEPEY